MKDITNWNYTPYMRYHERRLATLPYVCRLAPFLGGFTFEWFDKGFDGAHKVIVKLRGGEDVVRELDIVEGNVVIDGLTPEETYEFTVWRSDMSEHSATRLVRVGLTRGVVINYIHPEDYFCRYSGVCPASPSIVKLPSGKLLASMDILYGTTDEKITPIFESCDGGKSWHYLTELYPCHWGRLFVHRGALYCIGEGGNMLLIGRSDDEGRTWRTPTALAQGAKRDYGIHKGATPVVEYSGRIYTSIEFGAWGFWRFYNIMLSAPADADLLDPTNWTLTEPMHVTPEMLGYDVPDVTCAEGNAVATENGIYNYLRVDPHSSVAPTFQTVNRAVILKADESNPDAALAFDKLIELPCGLRNKFEVRRTPDGSGYVAVGNEYADGHRLRSILTLAVSNDGINFKNAHRILDVRCDEREDIKDIAYSDPAIDFDGDDIVIVLRVAANGAMDFHNNNMVCLFRVENYKQYFTILT